MKYRRISSREFDFMAHKIMEYLSDARPKYGSENEVSVYYNEDGLYTVHDLGDGIATMVYARNPQEAKERACRMKS